MTDHLDDSVVSVDEFRRELTRDALDRLEFLEAEYVRVVAERDAARRTLDCLEQRRIQLEIKRGI